MTDSTAALRHEIATATDLQSVVRTMRALAASSIHQYEQSVLALADYRRAVDQGLGACLREVSPASEQRTAAPASRTTVGVIVFGSDQGLVGQFNAVVVDRVVDALRHIDGPRVIWAVGERIRARLVDAGMAIEAAYPVPGTVESIPSLVDRLQLDTETHPSQIPAAHIEIFHNSPTAGALYETVHRRLLPLDASWRTGLLKQAWPTARVPQVMGRRVDTLRALIREHLFISLFQACAQSLASENASRLAAMERADKNIEELLSKLRGRFHAQRQTSIDEELFDVTAGYAALSGDGRS
ncbi:MAG: F0F1 ATP synthase subunit gamma [Burkholderiales bacterium]|nr:F0F1 ATP synthase subunit gamma [Burkholderiales bacterium]